MMDMTNIMAANLLLLANAVLLAAAAIAIVRFRKQCRRFEKFWDSPTGAALVDPRPATVTAAPQPQRRTQPNPQLENRVAELQSVVRTLAKNGQSVREPVESNLPIENAVRMAKHGASIDELIRSCGLNIGEAQLMCKLHGKSQAISIG